MDKAKLKSIIDKLMYPQIQAPNFDIYADEKVEKLCKTMPGGIQKTDVEDLAFNLDKKARNKLS